MTREQAFHEAFARAEFTWKSREVDWFRDGQRVRLSRRDRSKGAVTPYRLNVPRELPVLNVLRSAS